MTTISANEVPNATYEPHQAGRWLVSRHRHLGHLLDRVDGWLEEEDAETPDLDLIAEGINAADQYGVEWKAYEDRTPPPRLSSDSLTDEYFHERAYEQWEQAGPNTDNPFALAYLPMSSGEKRLFRMLAILAPGQRIRFHLDDTNGVSLQCCSPSHYGGPYPHPSFGEDWARLIAGAVAR